MLALHRAFVIMERHFHHYELQVGYVQIQEVLHLLSECHVLDMCLYIDLYSKIGEIMAF